MSEAEDAARYRWLKSQFAAHIEKHSSDRYVDTKDGYDRYRTEVTYWHHWQLQDDWRFGCTSTSGTAPDFDALVDAAMSETKNPSCGGAS